MLKRQVFSFEIIAYEVQEPESTTLQPVTIVVNDVNDNYPKISVNASEICIRENTTVTLNLYIVVEDIDFVSSSN